MVHQVKDDLNKKPKFAFLKWPKKECESKEAVSASSNTQLLRAKPHKESAKAGERGNISFKSRFTESEANPTIDPQNPSRFRVVLIKEGMGNLGDCYYYTKDALESAIPIFEGKKAYSDHPTPREERELPERSIKDVFAHYENCAIADLPEGRAALMADIVVVDGPAFERERALLEHAVEYSKRFKDQDFIGLSINANGASEDQDIHVFMKQNEIPPSVIPKMQEAITQGVTTVKVVRQITSAVSCDLVTEAGAGGRVVQMLEQEKKMQKKEGLDGKEAKEKKESHKEDGEGEGGAAAGADAGHADADQDEEMIRSMLMKHLGDGHDEDTMKTAKEAYQAALDMHGGDEKEAMETAGRAMKMAKYMAGKKPADGSAPADAPAPGAEQPAPPAHESGAAAEGQNEKQEAKKEAARVIALTAENAKLKESLKGYEMKDHLEKICRESGLSMAVTKAFRECVKDAKTTVEIDKSWKIFKEAIAVKGGEASEVNGFDFLNPEKTEVMQESKKTGAVDFGDCLA